MGSWLASLLTGSSPGLSSAESGVSNIAGYSTNLGQKNLNAASKFWQDILSGDSTHQAQALAPEISAEKTAAANDIKTTSELGSRSGGTAASTAAASDKVHSDITDLIGKLTGQSATGLAETGTQALGLGSEAYGQQAEISEEMLNNISQSLFGEGITSAVGYGEGYALGKIPGGSPSGNESTT